MNPRVENLRDREEAHEFFAGYPGLGGADFRDEVAHHAELTAAVDSLGMGYQIPRPIWIGVRDESGSLGAVLHASSPTEQALQILHNEPNLQWLSLYLTQNLLVSEIAVREDLRRRGTASALLRRAHSRAYATTGHPDEFNLTTFASTAGATAFFQANGYTVGAPEQPVPADRAHGLNTIYDPTLASAYPDGRWAWAELTELERS